MTGSARQDILARLRGYPVAGTTPRPAVPPLQEKALDREGMIARFTEQLVAQTGEVYRVPDVAAAKDRFAHIVSSEGLRRLVASTDKVLRSLDLSTWAQKEGLSVTTADNYKDRESWKQEVFEEAHAGITGADFAVAETGTLVLIHGKDQPRLVSLAPIFHIAFLSVDRLRATYEDVIDEIRLRESPFPTHITFITGPSMTADIQARPFKGMHGPRRLVVILTG